MRKLGLTAVALAVVLLFLSSSAIANTVTINAAEPMFPVSSVFTLLSGSSPLSLGSTLCCDATNDWLVQATAAGTAPLPSGEFLTDTISINVGGPGTLILWFTEQGVTSPVGTVNFLSSLTSNAINGPITSATLSTFVSPGNTVSPPNGTPLDSMTFTTIGTQMANTFVATGSGPYSLQEVYAITSTGIGGNVNLTIDITASAVPEPATLALVGTALGALGLLRRRR